MNLQENIHRIKQVINIIQEDGSTQLEQEVFPSKDKGYHVTPDIYIEHIKREGLTPKSESKLENHPERIYLYLNPESSFKTLTSDLLYSSKHKDQVKNYYVLEIDLTKLPEHKFYLDSSSSMMYVPVYTKQPIPPSAIKVVQILPVEELPESNLSSPDDDSKESWVKTDDYEKDEESDSKWNEILKKLDSMGDTKSTITLNENIHRIKQVMGLNESDYDPEVGKII
jgi:hypothetical protein